MTKDLKFLYETTINKLEETSVSTFETDTNGNKIETKRILKKLKPVKLALLKPDRKLFKAAEIFYSKTLADYLKAGLLPYSLVAKRYANDGGPLSDTDKTKIEALKVQSTTLEQEFFSKEGTDEIAQKAKNEILVKINKINEELGQIQNAYTDIFESTAEMKARSDTMEWWSFHLIYWDEDSKGYKCIFGDGDYNSRTDRIEEIEDEAIPVVLATIKMMSYLVSFWFTARNNVTSIEFSTMEKLYLETLNTYHPQEDKDPIVVVSETPTLK